MTYQPFVSLKVLEVTRELSHRDLARFRYYAPFIHTVDVSTLPHCDVAFSAWQSLERANPGPLPNLSHVGLFVGLRPHENTFPPIYFLLGHELRNAQLWLDQGYNSDVAEPEPNLNKLLASLPRASPQTSLLYLEVSPPAPSARDSLAQAVCGLCSLVNLCAMGIPLAPSALVHLCTLPHLHSLRFRAQSSDYWEHIQLQHPPDLDPFRSLEFLTIDTDTTRCVTTLLPFLRPPILVVLDIKASEFPSLAELTAMNTAIAALPCNNTLGELIFHFPVRPLSYDIGGPSLPPAAFAPLYNVPTIRTLRLCGDCFVALDDTELAQVARAWPHLQALVLCDQFAGPTGATVAGLLDTAQRCDALEELHVPLAHIKRADCETLLSAPHDPWFDRARLKRAVPCALWALNVGRAAVEDADVPAVAAVLSMVFPRLEAVAHGWRRPLWGEENTDAVMYRRWRDVSAALPAFVAVRDGEQNDSMKRLRAAREE